MTHKSFVIVIIKCGCPQNLSSAVLGENDHQTRPFLKLDIARQHAVGLMRYVHNREFLTGALYAIHQYLENTLFDILGQLAQCAANASCDCAGLVHQSAVRRKCPLGALGNSD
jgi:hypothetical protein